MSNPFSISVIVPFYNAEPYLDTCLDSLSKQDINRPYEIIMVDDASTDGGRRLAEAHPFPDLSLYTLPANAGPAAARNLGLRKAKGDFLFFLDVDDRIAENTLSTLYGVANKTDSDLVSCDREMIEDAQNQRKGVFAYPSDLGLESAELMDEMRKRLNDPLSNGGLFGLTGRLIRRSVVSDNDIYFEEKLRYLEDQAFAWDILGCIKKASYVRQQLYSYYVRPNVNTGLSDGLSRGFSVAYFKLVKNHIVTSLKRRGFSRSEIEKLGDQALIYFAISALVSYSRSMVLGKVGETGIGVRRKLIQDLLADADVHKAIRNYSRSKNESAWIPRAIAWRSRWLLEYACTKRAREILRLRRMGIA